MSKVEDRKKRLVEYFQRMGLEQSVKAGRILDINELAEILNISPVSYVQYSKATRIPDLRNQARIAVVWGQEIFDICGNQDLDDHRAAMLLQMFVDMDADQQAQTLAYMQTLREKGKGKNNNKIVS